MAKVTAKIYLTDGTSVEFGKESIQSVDSLSQSTSDASSVSYDVLSSTGSLQIVDINGKIEDYIKQGLIDTSSLQIELYFNDKLVRKHISSDNNYDNNTKVLTTNLTDSLSVWDIIKFNGYYYPEKEETAYEMLKNILVSVGYQEDYINGTMLSDYTINADNVPVTIKEYLESIKIQYPYLPADTLRATIDKFCSLAQLDVLLDNNGDIKFTTARPILVSKNNVIQIPYHKQYSDLSYSAILKNKYDAVEIDKYNVVVNKDFQTIVGSYSSSTDKYAETFKSASNSGSLGSTSVKITITYYNGQITIPKKENFNLSRIDKLYYGVDENKELYIKHNINYTHYVDGKYSDGSGQIATFDEFSYTAYGITARLDDISNLNTLTPENRDNEYFIDFIVATGKYTLGEYEELVGSGITTRVVEDYSPKELEITVYGDKKEIKFNSNTASSENINSAVNPIGVDTSELFSDKTTIDGKEITEIVKGNILNDYSNGISNGTLVVSCSDFYNENGDRIVNSANGELISVGDIVQVEGDSRYWRVTGSKFRKEGCPFNDLELMEVKNIKLVELALDIDMSKSPGLNGKLLLPISSFGEFYIDWGDGTVDYFTASDYRYEHTYSDTNFKGKILISSGNKGISFSSAAYSSQADAITSIYSYVGIENIKEEAFRACQNLLKLNLSGDNVKIGDGTFEYCNYLNEIIYNIKNAVINSSSMVFFKAGQLGSGISVYVGDNVENIPDYLFYISSLNNNPKIVSVNMSNSVKSIGSNSFYYCKELSTLTIGKNVASIGSSAFRGCTSLTEITVLAKQPPILTSKYSLPDTIQTIKIPVGTTSLYESATNWSTFAGKFVEI